MYPAVVCLAFPFAYFAGWVSGLYCSSGNTGGGGCSGGEEYYSPGPGARGYYLDPGAYGRNAMVNNGYPYATRQFWQSS